jgi:hypothetical protein
MNNQRTLMLQYLMENHEITGLDALKKLGIMCYTKVISDLRANGVLIESEWVTHKSRFGLKRFVKYKLLKVSSQARKMFL